MAVSSQPLKMRRCLGVLTSGGDSQGMNAALRAVVRIALHKEMRVFLIKEGYNGLVNGGEHIEECDWRDVSYIMHRGGTMIGTARCKEFMTREGQLKAAENLVKAGINNLVVIGGDGSLTGASIFKDRWSGFLQELVKNGRLTAEQVSKYSYLNIAGLVGSIDNDMCGTDMTIGTDSALHRIVEAIDCITSTASSHQRSFVMEIMGRHCGYLALMAGIAGSADWVLIPENPPKPGWEDVMCKKLERCRDRGRRLNLILIAEGAVDQKNQPITAQHVKKIIDDKLHYDTRITVLGHVQRGGKPSAYDRILGTRMGAAASLALARADQEIPPVMIGLRGNEMRELPLMECVEKTRRIGQSMKEFNFESVKDQRGGSFKRNIESLKRLEACDSSDCKECKTGNLTGYRLGVMNVGAPAGGTNSCTRSFVRFLLYSGHKVLGIHNGFEGLEVGDVREMTWSEVRDWGSLGGSNLGTNRTRPTKDTISKIAKQLGSHKIQALLIIGGFEAFESIIKLEEGRAEHRELHIPLLLVAATISNNVPGTEYSLGCDTALNTICSAMYVLKQSATASRKRVFVIETMGGYCGYLATMGALAGGADNAYIYEEPFVLADLQSDVQHLVRKFVEGRIERGIILRNENCNDNYTTQFMTQMLAEEGKKYFVARDSVLGHLQQGDRPSPFDRILGTKYASAAVTHLLEQISLNCKEGVVSTNTHNTVCVLGLVGVRTVATPVHTLAETTDFNHRIPLVQWWMQLRPLISVLSHHFDQEFSGEKHREESKTALPAGNEDTDGSK